MLRADLSIGMEGLGFHFTEDSGQPTLPNHLVTTLFFWNFDLQVPALAVFWIDVVQQILLLYKFLTVPQFNILYQVSQNPVFFYFFLSAVLHQAAFHISWYTNAKPKSHK